MSVLTGDRQGWHGDLAIALAGAAAVGVTVALLGPQAAAVMAAAAVLAYITARRPGFLFATYLLIPFYKASVLDVSPIDITPVLALLCALQVIPLVREHPNRPVPLTAFGLWVLLAVAVLAGILYAPDQDAALWTGVSFVALVLLPLAAVAARVGSDERHIRDFVLAFLAIAVATVLLGLTGVSDEDRLIVLAGNEIQTSRAALLVPLLAMVYMPRVRQVTVRAVLLVLAVGAVFVALASGSRGPVVALLLIGAVGAVTHFSRPRTANVGLLVATIGIVVLALGLVVSGAVDLPQTALYRFEVLGDFLTGFAEGDTAAATSDTSASARLRLMGVALELFQQQPLFGTGTSGFAALSESFLGPVAADEYPHNAVLQLAAEHGLFGVGIFIALCVMAFTRWIPPHSHGHVVRVLFIYFVINAMFSVNVYDDRMLWGLLILLLLIDLPRSSGSVGQAEEPPTWQGSYAVPTAGPQPSWVAVLLSSGWDYRPPPPPPPSPSPPPSEHGPYAVPPEPPGSQRM